MIKPEEVNRTEDGYWAHSSVDALFKGREQIKRSEFDEWCELNGLDSYTEYAGEYSVDYGDYREGISFFEPESPGEEWFIWCITDTEDDGAICIWMKQAHSEH